METTIIYVLVAFTVGLVTGLSLARPHITPRR